MEEGSEDEGLADVPGHEEEGSDESDGEEETSKRWVWV